MSQKSFFLINSIIIALLFLITYRSSASNSITKLTSAHTFAISGADTDSDSIPDAAEALLGTDLTNPDTDGDGGNDQNDFNPVLADNPIKEPSSMIGFTINSILVKNNVN